ncbi:MAG: uroporphyrinogen decarboxylase family protein [Promethearchaeota archaeon]|jgi:uroporphyrinogen decarboxylase
MDGGNEEIAMMTPRKRLLTTFAHKEPDQVPLTAKFWHDTRQKLRKHYRVENDEALFEKMGIDNGYVTVKCNAPEDWEPTPDYLAFCKATGYDVQSEYATFEEWGIERKLGSKGKSIAQQYFFSLHPWEKFKDPSEVENTILPDLNSLGRFDEAEQIIADKKDTHLILARVGHVLWTRGWELRGMLQMMKDLHTDPEMTEAILDKLTVYGCELVDKFLDVGVDAIGVFEDWANNKSMLTSPDIWRKYFKPRYKKMFDRVKRRGKLVYFHSDGNIHPIVGDLVEIGIDILNPVQPECMDQIEIKQQYGDKITIDTGISNQKTLPFGTPEDVRRETLHALKLLAPGGGFMYGTSHYAMYDVPLENILMVYETCKKYGSYPIQIPE